MNRSCLATGSKKREAEADSKGNDDDLGATALFSHELPFDRQVPAFYHPKLSLSEEFRKWRPRCARSAQRQG